MDDPPSAATVFGLCLVYAVFVIARAALSREAFSSRHDRGAVADALPVGVLNALFLLEIFLLVTASYFFARWMSAVAPAVPTVASCAAGAVGLYGTAAIARVVLPVSFVRSLVPFLRPMGQLFYLAVTPIVVPVKYAARVVGKLTRGGGDDDAVAPAAEVAVATPAPGGTLGQEEREMIEGIFSIRDTVAREVMVPRVDMVTIDLRDTLADIKRVVVAKGVSRLPVVDESPDNVVGVLHAKDVFKLEESGADIRTVLREPLFVPETKRVNELLREFRAAKSQLAIVVDEYGGTAGLITLEDVLEEIVGEIHDEYDAEVKLIEAAGTGAWLVAGRMNVAELNEELGLKIPEGEYETVAGFVTHLFGRVPAVGEKVNFGGLEVEVTAADQRRVKQVRLTLTEAAGTAE